MPMPVHPTMPDATSPNMSYRLTPLRKMARSFIWQTRRFTSVSSVRMFHMRTVERASEVGISTTNPGRRYCTEFAEPTTGRTTTCFARSVMLTCSPIIYCRGKLVRSVCIILNRWRTGKVYSAAPWAWLQNLVRDWEPTQSDHLS